MKTVIPAPPNFEITDSKDEIQVKIRTHKIDSHLKIVSLVIFSCWFLMGAWFAFIAIAVMRGPVPSWSLVVVSFSAWAIFGAFMIGLLTLRLTFQETITIDHEAILVEYESFLFRKRSYQYSAKHIQGLRVSPLPLSFFWSGRIVLDYSGKTVYFGSKLNESEARHILLAARTKFNSYDFAN